MPTLNIAPYRADQSDALWDILAPTFQAGDSYAIDPYITKEDAVAYWTSESRKVFMASMKGQVVGTYYLRPNADGGGAHVANCGYIVHPDARGLGIARQMYEHSTDLAANQGYLAMQFNYVISSNEAAIVLWKSEGFEIVGTLPGAFAHPQRGMVDVFIMYRDLV